jgi:hypothetical protein
MVKSVRSARSQVNSQKSKTKTVVSVKS